MSKIVFFGTPDFSAHTLRELFKNGFNIVGVITQPSKSHGRKKVLIDTPVKKAAIELGLVSFEPESSEQMEKIVKDLSPNIGVLFAYGQIISRKVLDLFPKGIVNIHPSLLPHYRGPSPVQTAILNGDNETGVSLMLLEEGMDTGPVLVSRKVTLAKNIVALDLHNDLAKLGTTLLLKNLDAYLDGKIVLQLQNDSLATYSKKFEREDGLIQWTHSAEWVYRRFRAFYLWPGIFCYWGKKRLKLTKIELFKGDFTSKNTAGEVFKAENGDILVGCQKGAIKVSRVQIEGKKEVDVTDFILGNDDFLGALLLSKKP
jgi:methionyl-tRNA formyltransferase